VPNENCSGRQPRAFQTNIGSVSSSVSTKQKRGWGGWSGEGGEAKLSISKFLTKKAS